MPQSCPSHPLYVAAEMAEVMVQKCLRHQIPTIQVAAKVDHQCRSCLSKWHHCSASPRVSGTMMTKTTVLCTSHRMWSSSPQLFGRMMKKTTMLCTSHQMCGRRLGFTTMQLVTCPKDLGKEMSEQAYSENSSNKYCYVEYYYESLIGDMNPRAHPPNIHAPLLHCMMCVPADKHHPDVHGARREGKMEKTIPIWYVVF